MSLTYNIESPKSIALTVTVSAFDEKTKLSAYHQWLNDNPQISMTDTLHVALCDGQHNLLEQVAADLLRQVGC
jgi:surfactin synthase thioesterase subunit